MKSLIYITCYQLLQTQWRTDESIFLCFYSMFCAYIVGFFRFYYVCALLFTYFLQDAIFGCLWEFKETTPRNGDEITSINVRVNHHKRISISDNIGIVRRQLEHLTAHGTSVHTRTALIPCAAALPGQLLHPCVIGSRNIRPETPETHREQRTLASGRHPEEESARKWSPSWPPRARVWWHQASSL